MPRQVLITTATLVALAAALGFWAGRNWQPLDETAVITGVARAHVAQHGGAVSDCFAVPGAGEVWIEVHCAGRIYDVDRGGDVIASRGPDA